MFKSARLFVWVLSAFFLVACNTEETGTSLSRESVESLLARMDDHYRSVSLAANEDDPEGVLSSYGYWVKIGRALSSKGYRWQAGEVRIGQHLELASLYMDFYRGYIGEDADLRALEDYFEKERKRLVALAVAEKGGGIASRTSSRSNTNNEFSPPPVMPRANDWSDDTPGPPEEEEPEPDEPPTCSLSCKAGKLASAIGGVFNNAIEGIRETVGNAVSSAASAAQSISNALKEKADQALENIGIGKECCATTSNPVELPTGAKVTQGVDVELQLLSLARKHRISQKSNWSVGPGWHIAFDSRIILGVDHDVTDEITAQQAALSQLEDAIVEINQQITFFETNYEGRTGFSHFKVQNKIEAIRNELIAERERIVHEPEQPSDPLVIARKSLAQLQATQQRRQERQQVHQYAVDPGVPSEFQIGNDVIKWVSPSGSRVTFNDPQDGPVTPRGGHSNQLQRTETGYRVETPASKVYHFNQHGLLVRVADREGQQLTIERDAGQRPIALVDARDRRWQLDYNGPGRLVRIVDPEGRHLDYEYDGQQRLVAVYGFDGATERYEYDYAANPLAITSKRDGEGGEARYRFAERAGRTVITRQFDESGHDWRYQYAFGQQRTDVTHRNGQVVSNHYNDDYKFTRRDYGVDGSVRSEYDESGNRVRQWNELGELTRYTHNAKGQVRTITDPAGRTTTVERDGEGRVTAVIDNAGGLTRYVRDASGQIDRIERPDGSVIDEDWQDGRLMRRVGPDGNLTAWQYDANGYPSRIDYYGQQPGDGDDAFRLMEHDALGRVLSVTEGSANTPEADWRTTQYFYYDPETGRDLDQPVRIVDPSGRAATYAYDGNNQVTRHRDFSGVVTRYRYTPRRNLASKTISMPDPAGSGETVDYHYSYEYDPEGNLVRAEHPGNVVWLYDYDARNRLVRSRIEGTDVTRTARYDAAGRVTHESDNAGGAIDTRYHPDGQVHTRTNPLGNVRSYRYDARGDLASVHDAARGAEVARYDRDALGRVTATTDGKGHTDRRALNGRGLPTTRYQPDSDQPRYQHQYDWRGQVVETTDAEGGRESREYNAFGEVVRLEDSEGGATDRDYDALGRPILEVSPSGQVTRWRYDQQADRLVVTRTERDPTLSVVRSDRERTTIRTYDLMGRLIAYRDAEQQSWTFAYNAQGLLVETTNPDGSQVVNDYNAAGQRIAETQVAAPGDASADRTTTYERDAAGRPVAVRQPHYPSGTADRVDYNGLGQPVAITRADRQRVDYDYDAAGRRIAAHHPGNRSEYWAHDANDNLTAYTDPDGYRWEYAYNADDQRTWAFDPTAVAAGRAYPGGQGTRTHYDALGRVVATTDPLGHTTEWQRDSAGRVIAERDAYGAAITYRRDAAGRIIARTDRTGATTEYDHNAFGDVEAVTDPLGHTTAMTYDTLGRRQASEDALGHSRQWDYNHRGQVTVRTDPLGRTTTQRYNSFGDLTAVARPGPDGAITSRYQWRADGRLTQATLAAESAPGATRRYDYDPLGRLTRATNELGNPWHYDYNAAGRLSRINQPEAGTDIRYGYDGRGHVTERRYADADGQSQVDRLSYDGAGRLARIDNPALTERYDYDAAGRLTAVNNETLGQRFERRYDANGRRTATATADGAELRYQRDDQGRIERIERTTAEGTILAFDLHRDALGRVTQVDYPNDSRRQVAYDALGRVKQITIEQRAGTGRYAGGWEPLEQFDYAYDAAGNLIESSRNGQRARFAYDSLDRLIEADYPKHDDLAYDWDERGNLVRKTTHTRSFEYQYNAANQLTGFSVHRLPGFPCDGDACPADDDDSSGSAHWYRYAYDANGQPTELSNPRKGSRQYDHDALGRMTGVRNPGGEWVDYGYDSRDRRVVTEQHWRFDEDDDTYSGTSATTVRLHSQYDGRQERSQWLTGEAGQAKDSSLYRALTGMPMEQAGLPYDQLLHQHLPDPARPELQAAGNRGAATGELYLYGDHQGNTVQVRGGNGKQAMRLGYSPFGQVYRKHSDRTFWKKNSTVNANRQLNALMPYQYSGRYTEAATGQVHLDARWYDPHTQRFVQPDRWNFRNTGLPMAVRHELMRFTGLDTDQLLRDPGQQMGYGYVSGNPLRWVDPLGLASGVIGQTVQPAGEYAQNGRLVPSSNPYSGWELAPRSALAQSTNTVVGRIIGALTQGLVGVKKETGALTRITPTRLGLSALFYTGGMAECQSLYCDLDGDGWSDTEFELFNMCTPGEN